MSPEEQALDPKLAEVPDVSDEEMAQPAKKRKIKDNKMEKGGADAFGAKRNDWNPNKGSE